MPEENLRTYLGDGVYASFVSGMIRLTAENGFSVEQEIFLELEVYQALLNWAKPFIHGDNYGKAIR